MIIIIFFSVIMNGLLEIGFPNILESELFRFYFTSFENLDRDLYDIELNLLNGDYNKNISSIIYIIQFILMGKVVEEISVVCKYRKKDNMYKIDLYKHIVSNKCSSKQIKEIYDQKRIDFPCKSYIISDNMKLKLSRVNGSTFLIQLINQSDITDIINVGVLQFNNMENQIINIEPIVKCIVKTNNNILLDDMKDINFSLYTPLINNNSFALTLTNQYRVSISFDKKENKMYVYDIGVVRTHFNEDISTVYSLTSIPKTKMEVLFEQLNNIYNFSGSKSVY